MSDQIIGATLRVDASSAVSAGKSITEMKDNVKQLQKNFEDAAHGSDAQAAALKKLRAAQEELASSQARLNQTTQEGANSFAKIKEGAASMGGPLGTAAEGVGKLNSTFLKLLANPIVLVLTLIVGALALLYKAFTNSFEGGEKMEQIFAGIKAAGQALIDNILKIAGAIVKLFKFDFSGAIADIKGVVTSVEDAYSAMAKLTKRAQELHREQLANDLDQAERAKKLAVLREQATDTEIPVAQRKAALLDLQKAAKEDAIADVKLAKETTENKIAQLTLQKDGARKNQDEITKLKVEQIRVETDSANELRRIGKQITSADKAEKAEQKAEVQKAAEEAKKRRQELIEFTDKLQKLQQDNELALTRNAYDKEKQALENKIADEKRAEERAFQDKKITRVQYAELLDAIETKARLERDQLKDKHDKEVAQKEADFQKELNTILQETQKDGLTDARAAEKLQLEITHAEKIATAIKNYKDDAIKLQAIRSALDAQLKAEQDKLDKKNKLEDDKKVLAIAEEREKAIIDNRKKTFSERFKALNEEQALVKQAFDNKVLTEIEYNTKVDGLSKARQAIREEEQKHNEEVITAIGKTFGNLSALAGKQTALGKVFAIAQTTIDTYQSAIAAYKSLAGIPIIGPALGGVAAATAVATGIAAVKNIVAVQIPGQGNGGGATPAGLNTPGAPLAPREVSTTFTANQNATQGNASTNRAYVLDSDIANASELNARLSRAARLGG